MEIASYLSRRKDELGLSLSDIEMQLNLYGFGVTKTAIAHWTKGTRKPPLKDRKFLEALAIILKVSIAEMLDGMGLVDMPSDMIPEARRAADLVAHMTPDKRKMALDVLEAMSR